MIDVIDLVLNSEQSELSKKVIILHSNGWWHNGRKEIERIKDQIKETTEKGINLVPVSMGSVDEEGSYPPNIETLGLFSAAFPSRLITGSNKWIDGTDSMLYETS